MSNAIQSIALDKLVPHPDNPNRMSKANFAKLVRNIKRTGRYEPLIVRPCPQTKGDCFQIINGHHRAKALAELGYETADVIVWDIDDEQADILLATLNRLGGSDILQKKLALLKRLEQSAVGGQTRELAKLLPQTAKQIERLTSLKDSLRRAASIEHRASSFANPLVFFLTDEQSADVEDALFLAQVGPHVKRGGGFSGQACPERSRRVYPAGSFSPQVYPGGSNPQINLGAKHNEQDQVPEATPGGGVLGPEVPETEQTTKAAKRAASLTEIARFFLSTSRSTAK